MLAPGDGLGTLTGANGVTFSGTLATFSIALDKTSPAASSPTAGSDYSSFDLTGGSVSLNSASLSLSGVDGNLKGNDLLFLIINGGGSSISGAFNGLAGVHSPSPRTPASPSRLATRPARRTAPSPAPATIALEVVSVRSPALGAWRSPV